MTHCVDTMHMAYNLPNMVDSRPDNTNQLDIVRLHHNTELHPPDSGKHHRYPTGYNHEAVELVEGELPIVRQAGFLLILWALISLMPHLATSKTPATPSSTIIAHMTK